MDREFLRAAASIMTHCETLTNQQPAALSELERSLISQLQGAARRLGAVRTLPPVPFAGSHDDMLRQIHNLRSPLATIISVCALLFEMAQDAARSLDERYPTQVDRLFQESSRLLSEIDAHYVVS